MLSLVNLVSKSIFGRSGTIANSNIAIFGNACSNCYLEIDHIDREVRYLCCPPSWPQLWYLGGSRDLG